MQTKQRGMWPRRVWPLGLMVVSGVLSACGGGGDDSSTTPPNQDTEQRLSLSGQIQPFAAGQANTVFPVNVAIETPGPAFTAGVNTAGQFDLPLPGAATMTSTYAGDLLSVKQSFAGCATVETDAPDSMRLVQINELTTDTQHRLVAVQNGGTTFMQWWFSTDDRTIRLKGSGCINGSFDATLPLKRGWNTLNATYSGSGGGVVTAYAVTTPPSGRVTWTDQTLSATSMKVDPAVLRPWLVRGR